MRKRIISQGIRVEQKNNQGQRFFSVEHNTEMLRNLILLSRKKISLYIFQRKVKAVKALSF